MRPDPDTSSSPAARILLRGHDSRPAHLEVVRFSPLGWAMRTTGYVGAWMTGTLASFALTWDPFVTLVPFAVGMAYAWRAFRGRYLVRAFRGECPRCETPLEVKTGAKIALPHALVCYHCHHEPLLVLAPG
jgi:hypothetical protein